MCAYFECGHSYPPCCFSCYVMLIEPVSGRFICVYFPHRLILVPQVTRETDLKIENK